MSLLSTPVGRLRVVSALEGLSYALLVFVAMPLKYGLDQPEMVKMLGMSHGGLFLAFSLALLLAWWSRGWSVMRAAGIMALSMVPLGAIQIERMLRESEPPLEA
jgi:integral membrane protein